MSGLGTAEAAMQTRAGTWEAGREPGLEALKQGSRVQGGSEGRATQQIAAWLSPAQHLGAGTSLLSFPGISRKKASPREAARAPGQPSRWVGLGQDSLLEPCVSASAPPLPPGPALPTTPAPLPTQGHSTGSQG